MRKSKEPLRTIQVVLTDAINESLEAYADSKKWNKSQVVREAIEFYIKDKKRPRKGKA